MTEQRSDEQNAGQGSAGDGDGESSATVLLALGVNAVIALGKFLVGISTGSSAMLSEGAHSVADTMNEGFLYTAVKRSSREPDPDHPFGYGKERFFWSLLAAVGIMVAGAGFSFLEAYRAVFGSESGSETYFWSYIVLAAAFVMEGTSWARAIWQTRQEARAENRTFFDHIRTSSDPTVKTVASEDSAALVGIVLAASGLVLHMVTGQRFWEGIASFLIGVLLVGVAYLLGVDAKGLLIGEAADERTRGEIEQILCGSDGVDEVLEVLTMRLGTGKVLVAARIDFEERCSAEDVEELSTDIENRLHREVPDVYQVFLDATDKDQRRRRIDAPYPAASARRSLPARSAEPGS